MKRKLLSTLLIGLMGTTISLTTTGCSVKSAYNQPAKKDMGIFKKGTPRIEVIEEIGQAINSQKSANGDIIDTYSFIQGEHSDNINLARAAGHTLMDIATIGLWELVSSTTESSLKGTKIVVKVIYDNNELIKSVNALKGEEALLK